MVTTFKLFESTLNKEPKIGDYVIVTTNRIGVRDYDTPKNFLETHIGKIDDIRTMYSTSYRVRFNEQYYAWTDSAQSRLWSDCYWASKNEILHISDNPYDLEIFIDANKYNL